MAVEMGDLNHFYNRVKLIRVVNKKERYYEIELFTTLFGDFCIERVYGATRNKKPTGIVKQYFEDFSKAHKSFTSLLKAKISKGYKQK